MPVDLSVTVDDGLESDPALDETALTAAAMTALDQAGVAYDDQDVELAVSVVAGEQSARLNGEYRDKNYATNVLSFPADVQLPGLRVLGDLVICWPVVVDEAAQQGKSIAAHVAHMTVHGTLHLLGFDHIGDDEAEIMEATERRAMAALGYANPYRMDTSG